MVKVSAKVIKNPNNYLNEKVKIRWARIKHKSSELAVPVEQVKIKNSKNDYVAITPEDENDYIKSYVYRVQMGDEFLKGVIIRLSDTYSGLYNTAKRVRKPKVFHEIFDSSDANTKSRKKATNSKGVKTKKKWEIRK